MKGSVPALVVLLLSSLLLASCGKTSQQKQMESELSKRVMQLHDSSMIKVRQAKVLDAQLDSARVLLDSLAASLPSDSARSASEVIARAKQKIASAHDAMEQWMAAHRPYDIEMDHDEAVAQLNGDIQKLVGVSAELDTAIVDATDVIKNQQQHAGEILSKKPMKKRGR
jgi:hypothetical protein